MTHLSFASRCLATFIVTTIVCVMAWHGPILQLNHYHAFANQSSWHQVPHAMDVLTNFGFLFAGVWGLWIMHTNRKILTVRDLGYAIFILCIALTAISSSYYHLAPDDARLFWDRVPIALACAGLLAGVRAETIARERGALIVCAESLLLSAFALSSVLWWQHTGDLRPYLLLQIMSLVLIPLYQWGYRILIAERLAFGAAILLYIIAKMAELEDGFLLTQLKIISGHSLKHLLAAMAAACVIAALHKRLRLSIQSEASCKKLNTQKLPYSTNDFSKGRNLVAAGNV